MIKVQFKKRVRFKLESSSPGNTKNNKVALPKLPLPGEYVERPNVLKIRK